MLFANNYHGYVPHRLHYQTFTHEVLAEYHPDPFASTHSLDTNPFDDPPEGPQREGAARLEEIRRREEDLQRRETELNNKAEHIRRHGRNNFPPCQCDSLSQWPLISSTFMTSSFPLNLPLNPRRNT